MDPKILTAIIVVIVAVLVVVAVLLVTRKLPSRLIARQRMRPR